MLKQLSPVAWRHVNLYGHYEIRKVPETININEIVQKLAQVPIRRVLTD